MGLSDIYKTTINIINSILVKQQIKIVLHNYCVTGEKHFSLVLSIFTLVILENVDEDVLFNKEVLLEQIYKAIY